MRIRSHESSFAQPTSRDGRGAGPTGQCSLNEVEALEDFRSVKWTMNDVIGDAVAVDVLSLSR